MMDLGVTCSMRGKLIMILTLIGGATSCVLCGRYEIKLFKKGVGPNQQPVIGKLLTKQIQISCIVSLTHLVIHKCVKVPTTIRLDVAKKLMKY